MPSLPTRRASRLARTQPARTDDAAEIVNGLRRIVKAIAEYSYQVRKSFGLTGPQLWALKTLLREGPLTMGHLANALAVQPSSLSLLIKRLVHRGLVQRTRLPSDRRVVELVLTKRGEALAARAPEAAQGRLLHGLRRLGPSQVRAIRQAIRQLVRMMEAADLHAPFFFADD
jgi:DNA-binding MarR family transcriptional regulator